MLNDPLIPMGLRIRSRMYSSNCLPVIFSMSVATMPKFTFEYLKTVPGLSALKMPVENQVEEGVKRSFKFGIGFEESLV